MKRKPTRRIEEDVYLSVFLDVAHRLPFDGKTHNKEALRNAHKKALNAARQAKKGLRALRGVKTAARPVPAAAIGTPAHVDPFEDVFGRPRMDEDVGEYEVYLADERGNDEQTEPDICLPTLRGAILYAKSKVGLSAGGESFVIEAVGLPLLTVDQDGVRPFDCAAQEEVQAGIAALLTWEEIVWPVFSPMEGL